MPIARLSGGPLDGQVFPLENTDDDTIVLPYSEGQVVYQRQGSFEQTGDSDGPTQAAFAYVEATQEIRPSDD